MEQSDVYDIYATLYEDKVIFTRFLCFTSRNTEEQTKFGQYIRRDVISQKPKRLVSLSILSVPVERSTSSRECTRVPFHVDIFSHEVTIFFPADNSVSTNCKSRASRRTKRHEGSRQRTYFTFIRSRGRLNHS